MFSVTSFCYHQNGAANIKIIIYILQFQWLYLTLSIIRKRRIFCNLIQMFCCRKGVNIHNTSIIFRFQRKCISTKKLFNVGNMASSYLHGLYSPSIQLTQKFCSIFIQQNKYILKNTVHFISLSDWLLTLEWIVYKTDAFSFQLSGL